MCAGVCSHDYHVCEEVNGELRDTEMTCPSDLVYDMEADACDYDYNVEECEGDLPGSEYCEYIGLNPDPEVSFDVVAAAAAAAFFSEFITPSTIQDDCSYAYYDCQLSDDGSSWEIEPLKCPSGEVFDPVSRICR